MSSGPGVLRPANIWVLSQKTGEAISPPYSPTAYPAWISLSRYLRQFWPFCRDSRARRHLEPCKWHVYDSQRWRLRLEAGRAVISTPASSSHRVPPKLDHRHSLRRPSTWERPHSKGRNTHLDNAIRCRWPVPVGRQRLLLDKNARADGCRQGTADSGFAGA